MTAEIFCGLNPMVRSVYLKETKTGGSISPLIIKLVCESMYMSVEEMLSITRNRNIVECRQMVTYMLRKFTNMSWKNIGMAVGQKDHSTAIYYNETMGDHILMIPRLRRIAESIEKEIVMWKLN